MSLALILAAAALVTATPSTTAQAPRACASYVDQTWDEPVRAAAAADCVFSEAAQTKGAEAWANAAAEDVALPGIVGRQQLRQAFEKTYAQKGFRLSWHPTGGAVYAGYVVTTGEYERHILNAGGNDEVSHGHYVTVWHRQKDGAYRFVWDGGE